VPNHLGYSYLAEKLASQGYVVVSINANRGVNTAPGVLYDRGLNLRRGRLVLKHLALLRQWSVSGITGPDTPAIAGVLKGNLDFSNVGMMGHSRGGEGVRAAYNLYRDPGTDDYPGSTYFTNWPGVIGPVTFRAIVEIGPVDGQTFAVLNADGIAWAVVLPMCDGDVSNLQGVRPFDRMMLINESTPAIKATYTVWGANHNFFNTEWQTSDSPGCLGNKRMFGQLGGSADQRKTAEASVLALLRGNVGSFADHSFNLNFNPEAKIPSSVSAITRIDRGYTESPSLTITKVFDDFPLTATNTYAASGASYAFGGVPNHSSFQRAAQVAWRNRDAYFQTNAAAPVNANNYLTLDFRVSRQCQDLTCRSLDNGWQQVINFSVQLVGNDGSLSNPVAIRDYISLTGPVGGLVRGIGASPHPILQTVRLPLWKFNQNGILSNVRGVRFLFNDTAKDEIYLANVRFSNVSYGPIPLNQTTLLVDQPPLSDTTVPDQNTVKAMRNVKSSSALQGQAGVEIELTSNRDFQPQGEMLVLKIGDTEFGLSRYPQDGSINTLVFTLTTEQFAALRNGDPVVVQYGSGDGAQQWKFGKLNKLI
jgi:hypothetical protein